MSKIVAMKVQVDTLWKRIAELEKEGCTPENMQEVEKLKKQINDLQVAIGHLRKALGLR